MNWEEYKMWFVKTQTDPRYNSGCSPILFACMLLLFFLSGCATKKSTESTIDYRHIAEISAKMDSLMHSTKEWQQSIFEKQTALVDSFKQSEVRDTSHTVFLNEKGDTTKEKTVIYIERNTEHSTKESEKEYYMEMFKQTDSLLHIANSKIEKLDSAFHSDKKDAVVEKSPSLMEKLKWMGGGIVLAILGVVACATAFMRKK